MFAENVTTQTFEVRPAVEHDVEQNQFVVGEGRFACSHYVWLHSYRPILANQIAAASILSAAASILSAEQIFG